MIKNKIYDYKVDFVNPKDCTINNLCPLQFFIGKKISRIDKSGNILVISFDSGIKSQFYGGNKTAYIYIYGNGTLYYEIPENGRHKLTFGEIFKFELLTDRGFSNTEIVVTILPSVEKFSSIHIDEGFTNNPIVALLRITPNFNDEEPIELK